jgi:hypothetical protein
MLAILLRLSIMRSVWCRYVNKVNSKARVFWKCSSEILCTSRRCCGDWGIMSIIYRIYTTGSV